MDDGNEEDAEMPGWYRGLGMAVIFVAVCFPLDIVLLALAAGVVLLLLMSGLRTTKPKLS